MNENRCRKWLVLLIVCFLVTGTGCNRTKEAPQTVHEEESRHVIEGGKLKAVKPAENDPVIGCFECSQTGERYLFLNDGTGSFQTGQHYAELVWEHKDGQVTVTYADTGSSYLYYDKKKKKLIEESEMSGTLIFDKTF